MFLAIVDNNQEMVSEDVFGCISMVIQGVIQCLLDIRLSYVIHSHIAHHQMPGRGNT